MDGIVYGGAGQRLDAAAAATAGGSAVTKIKMRVRDIWRHADLPEVVDMTKGFSAVVAPGGGASVAMFKLT